MILDEELDWKLILCTWILAENRKSWDKKTLQAVVTGLPHNQSISFSQDRGNKEIQECQLLEREKPNHGGSNFRNFLQIYNLLFSFFFKKIDFAKHINLRNEWNRRTNSTITMSL